MSAPTPIEGMMRRLKLGSLARQWRSVEHENNEQHMAELLCLEIEPRKANRTNQLVKSAGFSVLKTLGSFGWGSGIELPASISRGDMERAGFVDRKGNLVFMGSVGTGKTHLATALAIKACEAGKRAKFFTAASLGNTLLEKRDSGMLGRFMSTLENTGLLAIDEVGFVPLHKDSAELVFQVVSERYEKKSLIITSNLELSQWGGVFGDGRLVAAMVDRLVHHSHIAIFSGESYRLAASLRRLSQ